MILATLHTPNYTFQALGTDETHALKLMRKAWREHKRQTGAWDRWSEIVEDVYLCPLEPGMVLRDGSPLIDTREACPDCGARGTLADNPATDHVECSACHWSP